MWRKSIFRDIKQLKPKPACAVFQGLLCGGGATEKAKGEVPESLGGTRPDEPG